MLFAIQDTKTDDVLFGLARVPRNNANLMMLAPDREPMRLRVGESTYGRSRNEVFKIVRVE